MKTFDQYGRLLVLTTSGSGQPSPGFVFPHMENPDTEVRKWALSTQVDGTTVLFFTDPYPKAQDSDDGKWRYIYLDDVGGEPVLRIADDGDYTPGYELLFKDVTDGKIRRLRTREDSGQRVAWYEEV